MILVDSDVPIYLIGAANPHKVEVRRLLERYVVDRQRLVSDAQVLAEPDRGGSVMWCGRTSGPEHRVTGTRHARAAAPYRAASVSLLGPRP